MKAGFSTLHESPLDERFLLWTAERLSHMDYFRFEVFHRGLDRYFRYRALPKLNAHKSYLPDGAAILRRVFDRVKQGGHETSIWSHELQAPAEILQVYPELRTPKGDINLAHPLMTEFVASKYDELFRAIPEIDAITLTLTEVIFPVAHRFDNDWPPEECLHWLIRTVYEACRRNRKRLIVRPFSAIRADNEATRRALERLPDDIEVMLKCDPADWDPFLPLNPDLRSYPPRRLTVEFDLGSEYFGRGELPLIYPQYLRERLEAVQQMGVQRVIGRVDRLGRSALDREGRLNVDLFYEYCRNPNLDIPSFLARRTAAYYRTDDPAALARTLEMGFETVKKAFYVDGQLLFHQTFGDLEMATRCVMFETLRPNQPLDHLREEWHILADRRTPSAKQILREKDRAVEMADEVRERIGRLAPGETALLEHGENLALMARLYRATAAAILEYVCCVNDPDADAAPFDRACRELNRQVAALRRARGEAWMEGLPLTAAKFARELRRAFRLERRFYRLLPGLKGDERARLEDVVAVGYPGEDHRISKFTHGSKTRMSSARCWRRVDQHVEYSLKTSRGPKRLIIRAAGSGRMTVRAGETLLAQREWHRGSRWGRLAMDFVSPGRNVQVRFDRICDQPPLVGAAYLIRQ